ncbi:MIP family channel protein [Arthrobacter crystallopoietes BAB-32]|uniref:MIP family channel protein n=1 Tax=Arthrobacter crystallopoietes BAB-32 TaxID=1246476 RepID=N1V9B3_9MICC|nr:MIP/aquaporin family protein [Arthrobacter crystallopoietes]EMY34838.1 MIP family channel protein [Arthrobacter crystallopoietes BAB-32]
MTPSLMRRLAAEVIGTAVLVVFGVGSVLGALTVGQGEVTYPGVGFIALGFAIAVAVAVYAFLAISGAHINPAVTIALAVTRRFPWVELIPYFAAQLVGAAIGSLLLVASFGTRAVDLGGGATVLGAGVGYVQGIIAEALGTFLLMLAVMAVAVDRRAPKGWAGWIIGLAVAGAILVIGPLTGGSLNPARTFGPYVVQAIFGGEVEWSQFPLYIVGPFIGSIVAAVAYDLVVRPREVPEPEPRADDASMPAETNIKPDADKE